MGTTIFWFRRDLRLHDNAGLYHALKDNKKVLPIFIFDTKILNALNDKRDARVTFIHDTIKGLSRKLREIGSDIHVYYGDPIDVWKEITKEIEVSNVYANRDYEPYAKDRDKKVKELLAKQGIDFYDYKDHVIFEGDEILKDDGNPYSVFTPYKRKWLAKLESKITDGESFYFKNYPVEEYYDRLDQDVQGQMISLEEMGFTRSDVEIPDQTVKRSTIRQYAEQRNFPAVSGTSRLGIHFRFGTISIREKAHKGKELSEVWLSELIWRDFYAMILDHHPRVVTESYRPKYDQIKWRNDEQEFEVWKEGKTGYALVDAGMRELNHTGYMHNRVRMLVASFLTKHLLIDWRWGEAYFAEKLLDYDLASNNGGWQWAAGSGTDAAPYFRIFSPMSQLKKFDKKLEYVRSWVPEYGTDKYPDPIVDHKEARERCLVTYKAALD